MASILKLLAQKALVFVALGVKGKILNCYPAGTPRTEPAWGQDYNPVQLHGTK